MNGADGCSQCTGQMCLDLGISETVELTTCQESTWWLEAFPANPSAMRGCAEPKKMSDGCGPSLPESFASYDPNTCLWKTSQACLAGGWETFSGTWPQAGMMRNGKVSRQRRLVRRISGKESGLWPTPRASEYNGNAYQNSGRNYRYLTLTGAVRMHPTPSSRDWKGPSGKGCRARGGGQSCLPTVMGGVPNPTFVEWLMGLPDGWTDFED